MKDEGRDLSRAERNFEICAIIILLCFGIYHSVLYFGHQVVPNPDFTGFVHSGRQILSFQLPTDYKRAPVLGMLQVILSFFVGGQYPELTAGRLLNAILHPLNVVLLYLVGKKIVGRSAVWVAVVTIINPWLLQVMTEPIADTTLLFFVLITFYFIMRRSRWSYLFASIGSMVRFEGAVLIFAAFVVDMVAGTNKKERLYSFVYAAAASIPVGLWMLGTFIHWQSLGSTHYFKELGGSRDFGENVLAYIRRLWQAGFYPLFVPRPGSSEGVINAIFLISKTLVAAGFVLGLVFGLFRRRWEILALFVFLLPCFFIHLLQPVVVSRYSIVIVWILMLVCVYGFRSSWELIKSKLRIPGIVVIVLTVILTVVAVFWVSGLFPYLSGVSAASRRSSSVPYVGAFVVCLIFAFNRIFYRVRYCRQDLAISVFVILMIISNQYLLAPVMGDGKREVEFKYLADWYVENAKPGEKLVSTMANVLRIFAPKYKDCFVHIASVKADSPYDFVKKCYQEDITYVTWDSRLGVFTQDRYYRYWGIKNIAMLARSEDVGPYEFVTRIRGGGESYINVFRLRKGFERGSDDRERRNF